MTRAAIDVSAGGGRSSARREQVLTVAARLLREKGLSLSLKDIADELGITYNALYHHFKSRDDLLLHCFLRSAGLMDEAFDAAADADTGLERVMGFLRHFIDLTGDRPTPPGRYVVALGDEAQRIVAKRTSGLRDRLVGFVADGVADRSIADCDPLVTAVWVLHSLYWWPEELRRHRTGAEVTDGVFALVRRALAA